LNKGADIIEIALQHWRAGFLSKDLIGDETPDISEKTMEGYRLFSDNFNKVNKRMLKENNVIANFNGYCDEKKPSYKAFNLNSCEDYVLDDGDDNLINITNLLKEIEQELVVNFRQTV